MKYALSSKTVSWSANKSIELFLSSILLVTALAFILSILLMPAFANEPDNSSAVLHGKRLAQTNCANCHATGLVGDSPVREAPPFRSMSSKRSITLIGWELMNEDWAEHRKMPQFQITADQARDLVEWIRWVQPLDHGKRLVETNCSKCHAIGVDDQSPHRAAIPFRDISIFYPVENLAEGLAEGLVVGHPDMPQFSASPVQIEAIITYLASIQEQPRQ